MYVVDCCMVALYLNHIKSDDETNVSSYTAIVNDDITGQHISYVDFHSLSH